MGRWRAILFLIIALQTGLLIWSSVVHSPTFDEVGHLAAGISHWKTGRMDLYSVNPPLVRTIAALPVVLFDMPEMDWSFYRSDPSKRSEILLGRRMIEINGIEIQRRFALARMTLIPVALLGTWLCFYFANSLFGLRAGVMAAAIWAFSPSVLGYGSVITPDLASAVVLLGFAICLYRWLTDCSWPNTLSLSGVLGASMLTKSVWLILPLCLLFCWVCKLALDRFSRESVTQQKESCTPTPVFVSAAQAVFAIAFSLMIVNAFYGFEGSFKPLGEYEFSSRIMAGPSECPDCPPQPGNRFAKSVLGRMSVPLPDRYVRGIDVQRCDFESGLTHPGWQSYLGGQWKQGGWWYFYVLGLLSKEPLGLWFLMLVATFFWFRSSVADRVRVGILCLAIPSLAILLVVSLNTGVNRYVRYALPMLPICYVWASQVLADNERAGVLSQVFRSKVTLAIFAVCLVLPASLTAPHWLSYFNSVAGGSTGGYRVLCDSNTDWGQDLLFLKSWLRKHPEAENDLGLAYFGSFDPYDYDLQYRLPRQLPGDVAPASGSSAAAGPEPGWYAISKNYLVGHSLPLPNGSRELVFTPSEKHGYCYFRHFEPYAEIGHSMFIYKLEPEDVAKVRAEYGLAPLPDSAGHVNNSKPPQGGGA